MGHSTIYGIPIRACFPLNNINRVINQVNKVHGVLANEESGHAMADEQTVTMCINN